jgi:hypothetical protein
VHRFPIAARAGDPRDCATFQRAKSRRCRRQRDREQACDGVQLIIAAGAAGVELRRRARDYQESARAIDLTPPRGAGGIEVMDKAKERAGVICWAIGVSGTKMKIHKAAVAKLEANGRCSTRSRSTPSARLLSASR